MSKQEAFRARPQTSRRPRHPTVPAVPTANATGSHCQPWAKKGLPLPCTHLPLTTKGITRLGWKPVYTQARKMAQRLSGRLGCVRPWPRALSHSLPVAAQCPHG